jgi:hypothetical protein
MVMSATPFPLIRYFEGGNRWAFLATAVPTAFVFFYYKHIALFLAPHNIDTQNIYAYVFNLFAIELGALISLFALLACIPTEFLRRIRNTDAFVGLFRNIKVTLFLAVCVVLYTFVLGILKIEPSKTLTFPSIVFVAWGFCCALITQFYIRSLRLVFFALL